jgi:hypothetical protein
MLHNYIYNVMLSVRSKLQMLTSVLLAQYSNDPTDVKISYTAVHKNIDLTFGAASVLLLFAELAHPSAAAETLSQTSQACPAVPAAPIAAAATKLFSHGFRRDHVRRPQHLYLAPLSRETRETEAAAVNLTFASVGAFGKAES